MRLNWRVLYCVIIVLIVLIGRVGRVVLVVFICGDGVDQIKGMSGKEWTRTRGSGWWTGGLVPEDNVFFQLWDVS